jgi:hypothetical protein
MNRLIRLLYSLTVSCAIGGAGLIAGGFLSIPVLGFAAGTVAAVGTWDLALAVLAGCLLLIAVLVNQVRGGVWGFGHQGGFPRRTLVGVGVVSLVIVALMFVMDFWQR